MNRPEPWWLIIIGRKLQESVLDNGLGDAQSMPLQPRVCNWMLSQLIDQRFLTVSWKSVSHMLCTAESS